MDEKTDLSFIKIVSNHRRSAIANADAFKHSIKDIFKNRSRSGSGSGSDLELLKQPILDDIIDTPTVTIGKTIKTSSIKLNIDLDITHGIDDTQYSLKVIPKHS
jgi:uncharacterized protein (DUF2235 family)